jgi:hypothetical protein
MKPPNGLEPSERDMFRFCATVLEKFNLLRELGYELLKCESTLVVFHRGPLEVAIYHGRRSYEIGFEIHHGDVTFSLSEVIGLTDSQEASRYRKFTAITPRGVVRAVTELEELVSKYARVVLSGNELVLESLKSKRRERLEEYALDVLARQIRPQAELAFRERRYDDAAGLYQRIKPKLSATELRKLEFARTRSGR